MLIDECTDRPMGYIGRGVSFICLLMPVSLTRTLSWSLILSCMHDAGLLLELTPGAGALDTIVQFKRLMLTEVRQVLLSRCIIWTILSWMFLR
jgi:hypothetical protein